ncbi:hypothetical protein HK096_005043 [Nowakowskiella sp. JEL0078]|nr:hypothetical protein HK096_005043 [Nowakowskiella sp. JEL0078]
MKVTQVLVQVAAVILAADSAYALDRWGASFSFGPSTSRIIYVKTTAVWGRLPSFPNGIGPLFIWPGMSNSKGDLIQAGAEGWSNPAAACGARSDQWCVDASVFNGGQINGPAVPIDGDDQVTIEYKIRSDGNTWDQTVTSKKLGKVISTLSSASGPMPGTGFGFATEAQGDSYTIDNQYYINTLFKFAEADPKFGSTGVGGAGGSAKNIKTTDGGLTWTVDLITLPPMQASGAQSPPPSTSVGGSTTTTTTTTTAKASTKGTTTTKTTTTTGGSSSCVAKYGQCGGQTYTGPTCCVASTCTFNNQWYSQCI